ncbi:hypothetical protein [Streptomyces sp. NPDC098781]|uniref:hypothetical protein n=1 Tax=Streptomyces sp. NPDC098781 TaxID=3366097 RepID=UPI00382A7B42
MIAMLRAVEKASSRDRICSGAHVALDDPYAVARLLVARAQKQVDALLARKRTHVSVDGPGAVARPLDSRRAARPPEQAAPLAAQPPAAGHFDPFIGLGDHRNRFRFGREPDGNAAVFWTWEDLE